MSVLNGSYGSGDISAAAGDSGSKSSSKSAPFAPDIMLLDIRMPIKSGVEVMREFGPVTPFPVVAMTGNVDRDSVEEYR